MAGPSVKLDLKSIKLSPKQQQQLTVVVLVVVGLGYLYWNFLLSPIMKAYKEKITMVETKRQELKEAKEMTSRYYEFLQKEAEISRRLEFINQRLPKEDNMSDTIKVLTKIATECKVSITKFEPEKIRTGPGDRYKILGINIDLKCKFTDLGTFLTKLGYVERLTVPSKMNIRARVPTLDDPSNIFVSMLVKVYSFNETQATQ
ncbi:MAG: type 4a pilus biogenesis protein PilO [bacterium]